MARYLLIEMTLWAFRACAAARAAGLVERASGNPFEAGALTASVVRS